MFKHEITFTDYNGVTQTKLFHFNLSRAEVMLKDIRNSEMAEDDTLTGGWKEKIQAVIDSRNPRTIIDTFTELVFESYGIKTADGQQFKKSQDISQSFEQSEAFSVFLEKLVTDAQFASTFVNAIMPQMDGANAPTAAEQARARSEAQMQGFNKAPEAPVQTVTQVEPPAVSRSNFDQPAEPDYSKDDEIARLRAQIAAQNTAKTSE